MITFLLVILLIINIAIMIVLFMAKKSIENLLDCYIDVNMDTIMRKDDEQHVRK